MFLESALNVFKMSNDNVHVSFFHVYSVICFYLTNDSDHSLLAI